MRLSKKMMIVALHCIQTRPSDRPSMKEVLEMLDGDEDLPMPSKPYLYPHMQSEDVRKHISSSLSSDITVSNSKIDLISFCSRMVLHHLLACTRSLNYILC
ncbi:putative glycerophosphodiester phosphodiesterase [Lupinus albus]|uniref:Putative glycerophosphodiester phosphodiesterase n=1 Tax=Lupinus albus TaxID=3870 RepID=A0A6A4Q4L0_LUPAL|nr:putative glycerophosphodiester phosphodiesterase [Lupinus albus]